MNEIDLFTAAIAIQEMEERRALLDRECAGNPELRKRLERLVTAHFEANQLLDQQAVVTVDRGTSVSAGAVIAGKYKLLEEIGEGGMGTVWVAEQTEPVRRKVALKLIKAGMDSKSVLARFEAERQALAVMDHPNIAKVFDGGLTETGRPYFVMEYVKGVPITEYCDATRLSVQERLHLFVQVCQAVQHAHQKGIIHRDLKPSNILVAPYDDLPVPKVIDFGLAKAMHQSLTEKTLHTAHETVLGTPLYMSPEQAQLNNIDVDTRSDIYSLGVLLYELLTGTTPLEKQRFKEAAWDEVKRIIREEEPPRPSMRISSAITLPSLAAGRQIEPARLTKLVRGEIDWIVMKSLEKDRARRYETASGFAADVQRYLAGEPVLAHPPSASYRLKKFIRRHRAQMLAVSLVLVALLCGMVGITLGWIEAKTQEQEARRQERIARDETVEKDKALAAAGAAQDSAAKAAIEARRSAVRAEVVNDFLIRDLLAQADPRNNPVGDRITVREILDRAAQAVAKEPAITANPEVEAPIRYLLGNVYSQLGRNAEAEPQLQRALLLYGNLYGLDNDRTLDTVNDLSAALRGLRKLDEARELLNRTLAQTRRVPDDLRILRLQSNMGLVLKDRGEFVESEAVFRRCWDRARAVPGFDAAERLKYLANFAWILVASGDRMKATEAYQLIHDQLNEFPQVWGAESRDVYAVLDTLGSAARIVGRGDEAAKWLRQAWQGRKHVLGEDNEETLASLNNLALALLTDGKPVDAESLFRQAAAAAWPQGDGGMRSRATAQFNLGLTLKVQEKWSEAAEPMREALKVYRRQSGLADAETSMIVATLLDVLASSDLAADWEESENLLVELLPPIQKTFAPGSPQVIDVLNRLGQARLRLRKYTAAETPIREVLAIREKTQANAWTTFNTKSLLGGALLGQKKYIDAEPFLLAGYEGMKQREKTIPAQGEVRLAEALDRLIQFYTETSKPDEVKKWQEVRAKYPQPAPLQVPK